MMENGKKSTNLTDKERLYKWACREQEQNKETSLFSKIDSGCVSYLEDMDTEPVLEEYNIRSRIDMEKYLDSHFDERLSEIKIECIRAFLKSSAQMEEEKPSEEGVQRPSGVPEFIYNF